MSALCIHHFTFKAISCLKSEILSYFTSRIKKKNDVQFYLSRLRQPASTVSECLSQCVITITLFQLDSPTVDGGEQTCSLHMFLHLV